MTHSAGSEAEFTSFESWCCLICYERISGSSPVTLAVCGSKPTGIGLLLFPQARTNFMIDEFAVKFATEYLDRKFANGEPADLVGMLDHVDYFDRVVMVWEEVFEVLR